MDLSVPGLSQLSERVQTWSVGSADELAPSVRLPGGGVLELPVTKRPDIRSTLLLSLPKAGSTLLGHLAADIASHNGPPVVQLHDILFAHGVAEFGAETEDLGLEALFKARGYIYGPFRQYPKGISIDNLSNYTVIVLVRDPRDMMVSDYFSMAFSHPAPGGDSAAAFLEWQEELRRRTIDDVVLERMREYNERYVEYLGLLGAANVSAFRYEDIIYSKSAWVSELATLLGIDLEQSACRQIAESHDMIPTAENRYEHVRQVHPGNFRTKLQPATVEKMEEMFADVMRAFRYERAETITETQPPARDGRRQISISR